MAPTITNRLKNAWNAFMNRDPTYSYQDLGMSYSTRPDRVKLHGGNEKTIVTSIYNRIALDAASIDIRHAQMDDDDRYMYDIDSQLNECFKVQANIDQGPRQFIQDAVLSMFDEGAVALVPVETDHNPRFTMGFDISSIRTGKITQWFPKDVKIDVYNEKLGQHEEIVIPKAITPIVENPFYAVINGKNSTTQRLIRKLNLMDILDDKSASDKLNMLIQLPYVVKGDLRKKQADDRYKNIVEQLEKSQHGIAYIDSMEKVIQLNRPIENDLLSQVEYLTKLLFSQLCMTQEILDGSADEHTMTNYYTRTVEPIVDAITSEIKRKWLTKTARSQHKSIVFFRDPFKLISPSQISEIGDKMTRNEIMTSNELRQKVGMKPSKDPTADELRNKNLNQSAEQLELHRSDNVNFTGGESQNAEE